MFFFAHYLLATASGHATALLPVFLLIAVGVPTLSGKFWGLLFGYTLGLMGVLTPYATGPLPIYYACGYIRKRDFWLYGLIVGVFFFTVYMLIGVPWLLGRRV
ncbi:MAG: anion permease [Candidatus Rokubacteria bacterium]|nr:anion permease [Candidatus Rokubacteria bacterium]